MNIIDILIFTIIQVSMARLVNYLANKSKEVYMQLLKKVISIYFILLFPASIGLLCVSKQAVIIFGRGYTYIAAVPILMVFSIYLMAVGIDRIIEQQIIYVFGYEKADTKLALYGGNTKSYIKLRTSVRGDFYSNNSSFYNSYCKYIFDKFRIWLSC